MNDARKRVREMLETFGIDNISGDTFIGIEIRLMVVNSIMHQTPIQVDIDNCFIFFTRYIYELAEYPIPEKIQEELFYLRKNNYVYGQRGFWQYALNAYLECRKDIRIFDIVNGNKLKSVKAKTYNSRTKDYEYIIAKEIRKMQLPKTYAKEEVFYDGKKYKASVFYTPEQRYLEEYKKKNFFAKCIEAVDWNKIIKEMGSDFADRPDIRLKKVGDPKDAFLHILGGLGSGKSTLKYAMAYYLAKYQKQKVFIMEIDIKNVIASLKRLKKTGCKVGILIGSSQEEEYLRKNISAKEYQEIVEDESAAIFCGECIVKNLSNGEEYKNYPCNHLYEKGKNVLCNFYDNCGHAQRFLDVLDADIIITNPYAAIESTVLPNIEKYNRSIYEIAYDIADVVIIDEIDQVQNIMDEEWVIQTRINSGHGQDSFEERVKRLHEELDNERSRGIYEHDRMAFRYAQAADLFTLILRCGCRIVSHFEVIKDYIQNRCITIRMIEQELIRYLGDEEDRNTKCIELIHKYTELITKLKRKRLKQEEKEEPVHIFYKIFTELLDSYLIEKNPEVQLELQFKDIIKQYEVVLGEKEMERVIELLELLVILGLIEYKMTEIKRMYPFLYAHVHQKKSYLADGGNVRRLRHLVKEPLLGEIYGYQFHMKGEVQIDFYHYEGVGRSMLLNFTNMKDEIHEKGPCVVGFSATSVAPGSAHYNVKIDAGYLLLGKKQGQVRMHFYPKSDCENKPIRISGIEVGEKRKKALYQLVQGLRDDFRTSLSRMKGRKILLVINSYEDCIEVERALLHLGYTYRSIVKEETLNGILKEDIEDFGDISNGADICIVSIWVIARGYNILNKEGNSYFGSIYFLIRPYMVPGDIKWIIKMLHYYSEDIIASVMNETPDIDERILQITRRLYAKYYSTNNMRAWIELDEDQRQAMTWYMLIPILQTIGRARRNGNDCEVIFCDFAFHPILSGSYNEKNSPLYSMYSILAKCSDDVVCKELYNDFYQGFRDMFREIESREQEEEEW